MAACLKATAVCESSALLHARRYAARCCSIAAAAQASAAAVRWEVRVLKAFVEQQGAAVHVHGLRVYGSSREAPPWRVAGAMGLRPVAFPISSAVRCS